MAKHETLTGQSITVASLRERMESVETYPTGSCPLLGGVIDRE